MFRYANRLARFISAYDQGLSGAEAAWLEKNTMDTAPYHLLWLLK
jgi:hypothetical protein